MELALNTSLSPSFVASITFCFHPATQSSNISPTEGTKSARFQRSVYPVLELRDLKRTFVIVGGPKVNFFSRLKSKPGPFRSNHQRWSSRTEGVKAKIGHPIRADYFNRRSHCDRANTCSLQACCLEIHFFCGLHILTSTLCGVFSWEVKSFCVTSDVLWDVERCFRILIKKTNYITRLETTRRIY
jgi:hypothetical protein